MKTLEEIEKPRTATNKKASEKAKNSEALADQFKRVVIKNVQPEVESGAYPAKAVLGDTVEFSASVFSDGHDELSARLLLRHEDEAKWQEHEMKLLYNDHWQCLLRLDKTGRWHFKVEAWMDHFLTWKKAILKKLAAGVKFDVDLKIGEEMVDKIAANFRVRKEKDSVIKGMHDLTVIPAGSETWLETFDKLHALLSKRRRPADSTMHDRSNVVLVERKKAGFSTWYELFPRSASAKPGSHGTLKDVLRLLPRIEKLGFDTLYLPPIHPIGRAHRKGRNNSLKSEAGDPGSPWAIGGREGGHKSIHPELGTLSDLNQLIEEGRKHNIELALDIAFQCSPDHPYVKEHPEWFHWRPDGTVQYAENPPKKYEDIIPFNFETEDREALWMELLSIVQFWCEQGIRIFRVDNPHTKPFLLWKFIITHIQEKFPGTLFLAEAFTRPRIMEELAKVGFTQSYTYFTWRNTKREIMEYMNELTRGDERNYFRPNFWPNTPDILPPYLTEGGENAHLVRLILAATLSSNYGIYGPVYEFGLHVPVQGKEEYVDNEKYEIHHWDWDKETKISLVMERLNEIRRKHPSLQHTKNIAFAETSNDHLLCYCKKHGDSRIIVTANLDSFNPQEGTIHLPLDWLELKEGEPFRVLDLLSGDRFTWTGRSNFVKLNPYDMPAHLLVVLPD